MIDNQLIRVLKSFTPREFNKFEEFVNSPYFNKSELMIYLLDVLKDYSHSYGGSNFTKEEIFGRIFKGKTYNDALMRNLFSDMLVLAERFLGQLHYDRNEAFQKNLYVIKQYSIRQLGKQLEKKLNQTATELNNSSGVDDLFFRKCFDLQGEKINYYLNQNKPEVIIDDLSSEGLNLVSFFIICLAQILHDLHVCKFTLNVTTDTDLLSKFIDNVNIEKLAADLKSKNYKYYAVIEIFYYQIITLRNINNDEYYTKFRDKFYQNLQIFNKEWQLNLFLFLESCCVEKYHSGQTASIGELFGVYKKMHNLSMFTLSDDEYISLDRFRNVFLTAVEQRDYNWAELFIKNYKDKIHPEYKDNLYNYCIGYLSYKKGDYDNALRFITKVKYEYFVFRVDVKILLLMIYYELNYFDEIYSLIDSFKHFLSSNKFISKERKQINYNFLSFLKDLTDYRTKNKKVELDYTEHKLKHAAEVNHKEWLLEKISLLNETKKEAR